MQKHQKLTSPGIPGVESGLQLPHDFLDMLLFADDEATLAEDLEQDIKDLNAAWETAEKLGLSPNDKTVIGHFSASKYKTEQRTVNIQGHCINKQIQIID